MTVNALHKALGRMIDDGYGRVYVCIQKDTFQDNRENDGLVVMHIDGLRLDHIIQLDDDGWTKTRQDGSEVSKLTVVLHGDCYNNSQPLID